MKYRANAGFEAAMKMKEMRFKQATFAKFRECNTIFQKHQFWKGWNKLN